MKQRRYNWKFALVLMTFILTACANVGRGEWVDLKTDNRMPETERHIKGTIHYLDLEGGLYVIRDAMEATYHPVNLPESFRVDGMAIEAVIQDQSSQMSIGMVGTMVEIQRIKRSAVETIDKADLTGTWTVSGHYFPGISAMGEVEAKAWHGRVVKLSPNQAISYTTHCDNPVYRTQTVNKDRFLASEFNLMPESLIPLASKKEVNVLDVSCGEEAWTALGGQIIEIDANHALTAWDGVFFELTRSR